MKIFYFVIISFFLLIGAGCTGSKSYSNKAKKLQAAGLNDEAAAFFLQALQRSPKNVDAKIGLKQTGQIQIEKTLTSFYKAYSVSNYKEAVYTYQEALEYQKRYGYFVAMEIPPYYDEYYQEMLVTYLEDRYQVAADLLYEEKFKDANLVFAEILNLDEEFKDVKELSLHSTVEPLYRKGVRLFDAEKYRETYAVMNNVLAQKPMYKDAIDYKERALEEGQVTIAVLEFESNVGHQKKHMEAIQSDVISGLIKTNDPFIKIIDRSNSAALIKEQKINAAKVMSGNSAIKTGELLGANMLIKGKLLRYSFTGGTINSYVRQGFESYRVKKVNPKTKKTYYQTYYRRVMYTEYEGSSKIFAEVQYQMISAETGEVVKSDVIKRDKSDHVNYVNYKGNAANLYAGSYSGKGSSFSSGDVVKKSSSQHRIMLNKTRSSKKTLKSEAQLSAEIFNNVSQNIINGVVSYNPDEE